MKQIESHLNHPSLLIILVSLAVFSAACSPFTSLQPAGSSTQSTSGLPLEKIEQIEDAIPTRTPIPTPTRGPINRAVSGALEAIGISDQEILGLTIEEWVGIITRFLVFALIYLIGIWLVRIPLRWLVRRTPTEFDDQFFTSVGSELKLLVLVLCIDFFLSRSTLISDQIRQILGDVFFILYLLIFVTLIWRLVRFTEHWYRSKLENRIGKDRYDTLSPLITRSTAVILVVFSLALLLEHFGFQVSSVMVVGLVILVFYIAVRFVIADAVNGFIILFDQPFRIGDRIKIQGMDTWGEVIEIGTRTTHIQTFDKRVVVVPNSTIANQQLDNYTYPDTTYRMHLDIGIRFGFDIRQVQDAISHAVSGVQGVLPENPPEVLLIKFGDSGLTFRVRWWVHAQSDYYVMSNKINLAIIQAMEETGIEVALTSLNVISFQADSVEAERLSTPVSGGDGQVEQN